MTESTQAPPARPVAGSTLPPATPQNPASRPVAAPAPPAATAVRAERAPAPKPKPKPAQKPKKPAGTGAPPAASKRGRVKKLNLGRWTFLLLVIIPTAITAFYYIVVSSDQYRSEMRFSVRGTNQSPLAQLGLGALPGNSSQAADAYVVIDYVQSKQILLDIRNKLGIDVRQYFAKPEIDFLYRIDADISLEEFVPYWRWMIEAGFNSTTSITTVQVTAFSGPEATQIVQAILKVAGDLVNDLSTEARLQLISNAQREVERTENRLTQARVLLQQFRNVEQQLNPTAVANAGQELIQGIQKEIIDLEARKRALLSSVSAESPSARVINRQIQGLQAALAEQRKRFGSGENQNENADRNLSAILKDYNALVLEEEFAKQAYTTALSSLETSQAEARKAERYFAIVVSPTSPDVSLYPTRIINTIIVIAGLIIIWLLVFLLVQSVRDHSI